MAKMIYTLQIKLLRSIKNQISKDCIDCQTPFPNRNEPLYMALSTVGGKNHGEDAVEIDY